MSDDDSFEVLEYQVESVASNGMQVVFDMGEGLIEHGEIIMEHTVEDITGNTVISEISDMITSNLQGPTPSDAIIRTQQEELVHQVALLLRDWQDALRPVWADIEDNITLYGGIAGLLVAVWAVHRLLLTQPPAPPAGQPEEHSRSLEEALQRLTALQGVDHEDIQRYYRECRGVLKALVQGLQGVWAVEDQHQATTLRTALDHLQAVADKLSRSIHTIEAHTADQLCVQLAHAHDSYRMHSLQSTLQSAKDLLALAEQTEAFEIIKANQHGSKLLESACLSQRIGEEMHERMVMSRALLQEMGRADPALVTGLDAEIQRYRSIVIEESMQQQADAMQAALPAPASDARLLGDGNSTEVWSSSSTSSAICSASPGEQALQQVLHSVLVSVQTRDHQHSRMMYTQNRLDLLQARFLALDQSARSRAADILRTARAHYLSQRELRHGNVLARQAAMTSERRHADNERDRIALRLQVRRLYEERIWDALCLLEGAAVLLVLMLRGDLCGSASAQRMSSMLLDCTMHSIEALRDACSLSLAWGGSSSRASLVMSSASSLLWAQLPDLPSTLLGPKLSILISCALLVYVRCLPAVILGYLCSLLGVQSTVSAVLGYLVTLLCMHQPAVQLLTGALWPLAVVLLHAVCWRMVVKTALWMHWRSVQVWMLFILSMLSSTALVYYLTDLL